jgi:diguanylate cyclase (GGDEF)-like protein/PAS domain S-box-containing protein
VGGPEGLGHRLGPMLGSLKFRVALAGALALALGIGASTAILVAQAENDTLAQRNRHELGEVAHTAQLLSARLVREQKGLAAAAQRLDTARWEHPATPRLQLARLALPPQFGEACLAGADGQVRGLLDERGFSRPVLDPAYRGVIARTLDEGRPLLSDLVPGRLSAGPLVVLTHPLSKGSERVGVLAATLRLRSQDLLADIAEPKEGDEAVLVVVTDGQGSILAHPDTTLIGSPLSREPHLADTAARWMAAGQPLEPAGLVLGDDKRLVVAAGVAGTGWMVWRSRLHSDILAPLAAARMASIRWAAALVLVLASTLGAMLWWMLRPLARLERRAQRLFEPGAAAREGWPRTGGEIGRLTGVLRQAVEDRQRLEQLNDEAMRRLQKVMDAAPVGLAFVREGRIELASRQFAALLGQPADALQGIGLARLLAPSSQPQDGLVGQPTPGDWELQRADGSRFWAHLRAQPVDAYQEAAGTIWTLSDVTDEVAARRALEWAARHDPLTGLDNRHVFEERLAQVFAALPAARPAALLLIDLDRFKPINDTHGHAAGDAMLCAVATAAAGRVRRGDLLVRLGGDEFAVVLERCTAQDAQAVAQDLLETLTGLRLAWSDELLQVGASIGCAVLTAGVTNAQAWIEAADRACYAAKAAGRGVVVIAECEPS